MIIFHWQKENHTVYLRTLKTEIKQLKYHEMRGDKQEAVVNKGEKSSLESPEGHKHPERAETKETRYQPHMCCDVYAKE